MLISPNISHPSSQFFVTHAVCDLSAPSSSPSCEACALIVDVLLAFTVDTEAVTLLQSHSGAILVGYDPCWMASSDVVGWSISSAAVAIARRPPCAVRGRTWNPRTAFSKKSSFRQLSLNEKSEE